MGKLAVRPAMLSGRGRSVLDIAIGAVAAILVTLAGTLLFAVILRIFRCSDSVIPVFSLCLKALSALAGGILAARGHQRKGWMRGLACGLLYILAARLAFMVTGEDFVGGWALALDLLLGAAAGTLGGVLGVSRK